ncbi:hypothetical protein KAFR_0I00880 [Kazachstania africana CBS 2517]|uniref:Histone-lysine N-methyltransferase, H3 lysine-79 specific n=1 Tax=Kazachstania africana (strain ATCC 22294 / BCRC 22015 / CBS 2517 / CECT 1963 / NBRC 1671 / NRRL Y-8276) TaxID=1071382 RepID=H2AZR9_KAZAF|nr:hypothetical protein KAFR_0I00880 [Kazachstania africana CBS 2517]CCF59869.1 hypothetical protein KAFR_0I00880 [Kazachstania africana CBS 2517]
MIGSIPFPHSSTDLNAKNFNEESAQLASVPKRKTSKTPKISNELKNLLEDATRYDPSFDYSLPRSYIRTSNRKIGKNETPETEVKQKISRKPKSVRTSSAKKLSVTKTRTANGKIMSLKKKKKAISKTVAKKEKRQFKSSKTITKQKIVDDDSSQVVSDSSTFVEHDTEQTDVHESITNREKSTFVDWDGPLLDLEYPLFDIDYLNSNESFVGNPTPSTILTEFFQHKRKRQRSPDWSPTYTSVFLHSPLFSHYKEEYHINFAGELDRYNPMSEIGKAIEYTALVYLPEQYSKTLQDDIIKRLNEAYDKENLPSFVEAVSDYNSFIGKIPRSEIINHLQNVKQVPQTFIHDFLHIPYTRTIHLNASKLKHYEAFSNYVYGELLPGFLTEVFLKCGLGPDKTFMDLGSGVGNCVIQAALEHGCKLSLGCEIMPDASELAELQYKELLERCKLMGFNMAPIEFLSKQSFVNNDRINQLVPECDVLLINNFLFDSALNREVQKILQSAKPGCKIISLKNLRSFGHTINFNDLENILNRIKVEKSDLKENSVSWTHNGGEYYISTVLEGIDESLLDPTARFRRQKRQLKYTR